MAVLIFLTSKPSLLFSNLNKELKLIFSPYQVYDISNTVIIYSAIVPHLFLLQTYAEWQILIGFSYRSNPAGFGAVSMSFLNFLSQKTYLAKFSRPEVI